MIKLSKINQRGDTIVEVLIALTVVGFMLTGAYASARRSLFAVRASQERLEALKYAEGQIEMIKYDIGTASPTSLTITAPFCMDDNNALPVGYSPTYCNLGVDGRYKMSIERSNTSIVGPPPATEYTFTVTASWDRIGGGGSDSLSLSYKVRR